MITADVLKQPDYRKFYSLSSNNILFSVHRDEGLNTRFLSTLYHSKGCPQAHIVVMSALIAVVVSKSQTLKRALCTDVPT